MSEEKKHVQYGKVSSKKVEESQEVQQEKSAADKAVKLFLILSYSLPRR